MTESSQTPREGERRFARAFNNVCHVPMFDMEPTQVSPPFLHIFMLGIVERYHTLQQDCHSFDEEIGMALAKKRLMRFLVTPIFL